MIVAQPELEDAALDLAAASSCVSGAQRLLKGR